jgi:AcrR family transcriptional regulator
MYSAATRTALLDEAETLFAERGFAGTSLEDIASAAQVTRGAVYHHFAGKQALFEALIDRLESTAMTMVAKAAATRTDPWESAMTGLDAFLDHCCDPVYGRLVWQEGPVGLGWATWRKCEEKYAYGLVAGFVQTLTEAGYLQPVPVGTAVRLLFSLLGSAGLALTEATDADRPRIRQECGDLLHRVFTGLRTDTPSA